MANFLQTLIPLSLLLLAAIANTATSQSIYFNYDFTSTDIHTSLLYQGDAHFPSDSTHLRLTKTNASGYPETNSVGRVVYSNAVSFSSNGQLLDFATSIIFKITPVDNKPADGLAFFIAPHGTTIPAGSTGGNLGIFGADGSNANILAIEFDTFYNPGTDGTSFPHVGIDFESPVSSNLTVVGDAMIGQKVTAYITYEHASKLITVSLTAGSKSFVVGYVRDLSNLLSEEAQIGISAATGGNVAVHDIASWYFLSFADVAAANADGGGKIRQVVG